MDLEGKLYSRSIPWKNGKQKRRVSAYFSFNLIKKIKISC